MEVALLYDCLGRSRGGVEAWLYHAAEALAVMGHTPYGVAKGPDLMPPDAMPPDVEVIKLKPAWRPRTPGLEYWKLYHAFSRQLRDISRHTDQFWSSSYMMTLAANRVAAGRPVLFVQATPFPVWAQLNRQNIPQRRRFLAKLRDKYKLRMTEKYERLAMEGCTALVYVSRSRQEEILAYYGEEFRPKSHVVAPGVDPERFTPGARRWNGEGPLRTLSVCRLSVEKNMKCLIRALGILRKRDVHVVSTIVGDGVHAEFLRRLAVSENVADRVVFAGMQEEVERFYREADVFVLPSTYEGFGIVYLEAFASGLPCIAIRRVPGKILVAADEIIEPNETGLLIDEDSPELLAEALIKAYRSPEDVRRWSGNARRVAETRYTWRRAVQSILDIAAEVSSKTDGQVER